MTTRFVYYIDSNRMSEVLFGFSVLGMEFENAVLLIPFETNLELKDMHTDTTVQMLIHGEWKE